MENSDKLSCAMCVMLTETYGSPKDACKLVLPYLDAWHLAFDLIRDSCVLLWNSVWFLISLWSDYFNIEFNFYIFRH